MSKKPAALGRGLGSLIETDSIEIQNATSIDEISLSKIQPNPDQPRRIFDEEDMAELTASIKEVGVITPITLRKLDNGNYQIIAGERRYRASLKAERQTIPAYIIENASEEDVVSMSLIENIQRKDLNAIEVAITFQKMIQLGNLTQEQLSKKVAKNRTTIANHLRLLNLPAEIQLGITNRKIDMGHARELVSINDPLAQLELYELILEEGLSVRKVEEYAGAIKSGNSLKNILDGEKVAPAKTSPKGNKKTTPEEYDMLGQQLFKLFRAKVQLTCNDNGKGKISIPFNSDSELARIITIFDNLNK